MTKEVGIVKVLSLLWLSEVGEEILFLVAHLVTSIKASSKFCQ